MPEEFWSLGLKRLLEPSVRLADEPNDFQDLLLPIINSEEVRDFIDDTY